MPRFDERDTLFSRMTLTPGSDRYRDYYRKNPGLESSDRDFREAVPGKYADRNTEQNFIESTFSLIARLRKEVRGAVSEIRTNIDSSSAGKRLKLDARSLTACSAGIAETSPNFVYSIRGRGERYNRPVDDYLPFTFVMAFEMDRDECASSNNRDEIQPIS